MSKISRTILNGNDENSIFILCLREKSFIFSTWSMMLSIIITIITIIYCKLNYIGFWMLSQPCIPKINPTWLWYTILFIQYWALFINILLGIFAGMFMKDIGLWFSFLAVSLSGTRVIQALWNEEGSVPSSIFWKSFYRFAIISSINTL